MNEIAALGSNFATPTGRQPAARSESAHAPPAGAPTDRVELSSAAEEAPPTFSPEVERYIAAIRQSIADDSYLTPDKIDAVVERLFEELCRGAR